MLGGPVELHCQSDAIPPPTLSWRKDGRPLFRKPGLTVSADGSVLKVDLVIQTDVLTSFFTCISWPATILNARFKALRCRIQVDIHVKPPMLPAKRRRTITSTFGVSEQRSVHEEQLCPFFCIVCVPFFLKKKKRIMWMCRFGRRICDAKAATETVTGLWKVCERLPLVSCVIAVAPSIRGSDELSSLTVTEGNPITMVCESSGIPPPSLGWRKDGERADHQTGSNLV